MTMRVWRFWILSTVCILLGWYYGYYYVCIVLVKPIVQYNNIYYASVFFNRFLGNYGYFGVRLGILSYHSVSYHINNTWARSQCRNNLVCSVLRTLEGHSMYDTLLHTEDYTLHTYYLYLTGVPSQIIYKD